MESTKVVGDRNEGIAANALRAAGYAIVAQNYRCKAGELDVVARDGEVLVFVEVRSRSDHEHGHAAEMVNAPKRGRVTRIARHYLALERPDFDECRFDVVAITGDEIEIIKDAWRV